MGNQSKRKRNTYFAFKQFTINQGQTAMKVSTEACLLGAWATWPQQPNGPFLDVGTGTGLLALMVAQRYPNAPIDAIEINAQAARQAQANVAASPWHTNISVHQAPVQQLAQQPWRQATGQYAGIIVNPPFYQDHTLPQNAQRAGALHTPLLPMAQLLSALHTWLAPTGLAYVLLPPWQSQQLVQQAATQGLHLHKRLEIRNFENQPDLFRVIVALGHKAPSQVSTQALHIYQNPGGPYTPAFVQLLKPYYLYL